MIKQKKAVFLRDIVALSIALALVEVDSYGDDHAGELKVLHKNRDRKDLKKMIAKLDQLKELRLNILDRLQLKDIEAIQGLSHRFFSDFIQTLKFNTGISLEFLAVQVINHKFTERDDLHESLRIFARSWGIHALTKTLLANNIECTELETTIANVLADKITRI